MDFALQLEHDLLRKIAWHFRSKPCTLNDNLRHNTLSKSMLNAQSKNTQMPLECRFFWNVTKFQAES